MRLRVISANILIILLISLRKIYNVFRLRVVIYKKYFIKFDIYFDSQIVISILRYKEKTF